MNTTDGYVLPYQLVHSIWTRGPTDRASERGNLPQKGIRRQSDRNPSVNPRLSLVLIKAQGHGRRTHPALSDHSSRRHAIPARGRRCLGYLPPLAGPLPLQLRAAQPTTSQLLSVPALLTVVLLRIHHGLPRRFNKLGGSHAPPQPRHLRQRATALHAHIAAIRVSPAGIYTARGPLSHLAGR